MKATTDVHEAEGGEEGRGRRGEESSRAEERPPLQTAVAAAALPLLSAAPSPLLSSLCPSTSPRARLFPYPLLLQLLFARSAAFGPVFGQGSGPRHATATAHGFGHSYRPIPLPSPRLFPLRCLTPPRRPPAFTFPLPSSLILSAARNCTAMLSAVVSRLAPLTLDEGRSVAAAGHGWMTLARLLLRAAVLAAAADAALRLPATTRGRPASVRPFACSSIARRAATPAVSPPDLALL